MNIFASIPEPPCDSQSQLHVWQSIQDIALLTSVPDHPHCPVGEWGRPNPKQGGQLLSGETQKEVPRLVALFGFKNQVARRWKLFPAVPRSLPC